MGQHSPILLRADKESAMLKTLASMIVVVALFCTLGIHATFASEPETKGKAAETATAPVGPYEKAVVPTNKSNEKLRAGILKLVHEAEAGKVMLPAKSQIQPAKGNNWSKGTKIAVGVGVAIAVVVVILVVKHQKDHFLDGLTVF
jgi:hypothetical protein